MTAPPRPSLAASTPSTLPPACGVELLEDGARPARCPSRGRPARRRSCSCVIGSSTVCAPSAKSVALLSVGEPLRSMMFAVLVAEAVGQALALQLADLGVVERDVVVGRAAEGEPVVVDGRDALRAAFSSMAAPDSESRLTIASTLTPSAIMPSAIVRHLLRVALGVLDVVLDTRLLEGRLERRPVGALPAHRGLGVGEDHADLAGAARSVVRPRVAATVGVVTTRGEGQGRPQRPEDHQAVLPLHANRLLVLVASRTPRSDERGLLRATTYEWRPSRLEVRREVSGS